MSRISLWLLVLGASAAVACSGNSTTNGGSGSTSGSKCISGADKLDCQAKMEVRNAITGQVVSNKSVVEIDVGNIPNGLASDVTFTVANTNALATAADLVIESIRLDYEIASPQEADVRAFECYDDHGHKCDEAAVKWRKVVPPGLENAGANRAAQEIFHVRYTRFDTKDRQATLHVKVANDNVIKDFVVVFQTKQGKPKAVISPAGLTFPYIESGKTLTDKFKVSNVGDALLVLKSLEFNADSVFSVTTPDGKSHSPGSPVVFDPALELENGKSIQFDVTFAPKDDKKKQGTILVMSNDPATPNGAPVALLANSSVPCILVIPGKLNFGGALVGGAEERTITIKNCGSDILKVSEAVFSEGNADGEFKLDWANYKVNNKVSAQPDTGPTTALPLSLGLKDVAELVVRYEPKDVSPIDAATQLPKPDTAVIQFTSNAFQVQKVATEGIGVKQTCPMAKISVKEGEEVVPQTLLHLKGDQSTAPGGGTIKKYKWTVKQPSGSSQPLVPKDSFPNPMLQANAAGEFVFCLDVWDQNDMKSCAPACVTVAVLPSNAIHVELLWDTPADPDQTDSGPAAGADMDLHFAHPLASGPDIDCDGSGDPWFSNPWDTFWFNSNPNWGSSNPAAGDDPSLDLDDTDGAGPENLNLEKPEGAVDDPVAYSVGVHYWNDHGYGTSFATVSIYLQGTLSLQLSKVQLDPLDMWFVGKINWPNQLTGASAQVFTMCYQSAGPDACSGGKMWVPTGPWCITKCYENKSFTASAGGAAPAACKKKP